MVRVSWDIPMSEAERLITATEAVAAISRQKAAEAAEVDVSARMYWETVAISAERLEVKLQAAVKEYRSNRK